MKLKQKPVAGKNMTWSPTVEDRKLIDSAKAKLGLLNESEILRLALRALVRELAANHSR